MPGVSTASVGEPAARDTLAVHASSRPIAGATIYNGALNPADVAALATTHSPCSPLPVAMVQPGNNALYQAPASVELVAAVTATNSPLSKLEFYLDATLVGTT